jgi:aspartyl/asparaginyl beta-hydroxylase (cupin superfamily)
MSASAPDTTPDPLALVRRGDQLAAQGDTRSAAAFYQAALRAGATPQRGGGLDRELERVRGVLASYAQQYTRYLTDHLTAQGFRPGVGSPRFAESLDIVLGRKQIFFQNPRYYFFPGLPQIQFYDRAPFPWFAQLESHTDAIRDELLELLRTPDDFKPYVQGDPNRPSKAEAGMLNNPDWSAFYLWKNGNIVTENARRCPRTMQALQSVPLGSLPQRSPSVLFSLLRPGAHIPPHCGLVNTRLICHLPLIVPEGCRFRVGNETREWRKGVTWAFDDTIEHEAWNDSNETRVILLFEIWRPELTLQEREWVTQLFVGIDRYNGAPPAWEI